MIRCRLCDAVTTDVESAIEAGWFPSFWVGEEECPDPVCEPCSIGKMEPGDGELVLRPEFAHLLAPASDTPHIARES